MTPGKIVILSGPSGAGKTTLYKKLLACRRLKNNLVKSVSVTTRPPRLRERHSRDYFFISKKDFVHKKKSGELLESQKVIDHYYGTPKTAVEKILKSGKNVLLCIDVKGARVVSRQFPQAVTIFVKTPTLAELKKRLLHRKTENGRGVSLRLKLARQELKQAGNYDFVLINDDLNKAYHQLLDFLCSRLLKRR